MVGRILLAIALLATGFAIAFYVALAVAIVVGPRAPEPSIAPAWGAWDDCAPFGAADYRCPFLNPNHAEAAL